MAVSNARDLIQLHEGCVPYAYQDSLGLWTIGVGHLIDKSRGGKLPDEIIKALLDYDIQAAIAGLLAKLPWSAGLDPVRQAVLVDMTFNLGLIGLLGFPQFLAHLRAGEYDAAADAMLDSRWATQVGERAKRLSMMVRTGQWPVN